MWAPGTTGTMATPFGFAGQHGYQTDTDSGLMRLGHRYYDSSTGRFLSRDPIQDGYNWYAYCENDPINAVDPEGLQTPIKPLPGSGGLNPGTVTIDGHVVDAPPGSTITSGGVTVTSPGGPPTGIGGPGGGGAIQGPPANSPKPKPNSTVGGNLGGGPNGQNGSVNIGGVPLPGGGSLGGMFGSGPGGLSGNINVTYPLSLFFGGR